MPVVATRWRPVYTASTWATVWKQMHAALDERSRGARPGPPMTNAEAAAFIREWRDVSHAESPLWWQFAAVAYGWQPSRDELDQSAQQAARWYPPSLVEDLWKWARDIAAELDARNDGQPPRVAVDLDTFGDPVFFGGVRAQLMSDGARAAFKIPLPACRDKKTGKLRYSRPPCDKHGRGPLVGYDRRGRPIYAPCDKKGDCEPVAIDDPLTAIGKDVSTLLLVVGAVWLLTRPTRRSRRD